LTDRITLVDIGARGGIDARWKPFYEKISVIGFEADPNERRRLNARQWPYPFKLLPAALGASDGEEATLYITAQPGCSSLLRPNYTLCSQFDYGRAMEVREQIKLKLSRLDTALTGLQPDVIKIDTQGTELDILKGAGRLLNSTIAVECEVEFVELYEGQPLFGEVDAFLRSAGFALRGLRRTCWRNRAESYLNAAGGQLIHGDALWLRPALLSTPKAFIALAAYRQFDLLSMLGVTDLVPRRSWLDRAMSTVVATTGFTNRGLRRFVDRLRPVNATDWHDADFF
jgi:FkbM family methyltransferase